MPRTSKRVRIAEPCQVPELPNLVTLQGTYLKWHVSLRAKSKMPDQKRGDVIGFSAASRLRLMKWFNTLDWENAMPAIFITLTFPDDVTIISKYALNMYRWRWWRYLEKHLGKKVCGVWRVEWKPRLTGKWVGKHYPHFHLMIFRTRYVPKELITGWWEKTLNVEKAVTHVQAIENNRMCGAYISKYVAKAPDELVINAYLNSQPTGRNWGFFRKNLIPLSEKYVVALAESEEVRLAKERALNDKPEFNKWGTESFSLLGPMALIIAGMIFGDDEVDVKLPRG